GIRIVCVHAEQTILNLTVTGVQTCALPICMDLASNPAISGVTMTNNGVNGLQVDGGTISADTSWDDPDINYVIQNDVTVAAGKTDRKSVVQGRTLDHDLAGKLIVNAEINTT